MQHFNFPNSFTCIIIIIAAIYWAPAGCQVVCEALSLYVLFCFSPQSLEGLTRTYRFRTNEETTSPWSRREALGSLSPYIVGRRPIPCLTPASIVWVLLPVTRTNSGWILSRCLAAYQINALQESPYWVSRNPRGRYSYDHCLLYASS